MKNARCWSLPNLHRWLFALGVWLAAPLALVCLGSWRSSSLAAGPTVPVVPTAFTAEEKAKPQKPDASQTDETDVLKKTTYWLGISCSEIPEAVQAQVDLDPGQGIIVVEVAKGSPAEKAGIKPHDILLEADGKRLTSVDDLARVVNEKKSDAFELKLLRKGKVETLRVAGEPKPPESVEAVPPFPGPFGSREDWEKWFEWFRKRFPGEPPLTFRFYRPGVVVPPGASAPLPKDLTIVITKQGEGPAKIVVKRGDKTWETTENELDKLPADIRPHVEQMLRGSQGWSGRIIEVKPFAPGTPGELEKRWIRPFRPWSAAEAERIDKLEKRIAELEKKLEKLQAAEPAP